MGRSASYQQRESILPGPSASTGYHTLLLLGTTGAGKTTLVRQLIGTDPVGENFPATASFKTTTSETEVLCAPGDYYAVATFASRPAITATVEECVVDAAIALVEGRSAEVAADALRAHRDLRLRLEYVLGPSNADDPGSWLGAALNGVRNLVANSVCDSTGAQLEAHIRHLPETSEIVKDLVGAIELRFGGLIHGQLVWGDDGWPVLWRLTTGERGTMISALQRVAGNERATFGAQLSPVVDGLRVRGPFHPRWAAEIPYLMAVDTVGLGHTPDTAATLPAAVLEQLPHVDRIIVVDDATHPLQAAPIAALRQLGTAGHMRKVALCFTHADRIAGPTATRDDQIAQLRRSVQQVVEGLRNELDPATHRQMQTQLDEQTYVVGSLDQLIVSPDGDDDISELTRLLAFARSNATAIEITDLHPLYRLSDLRNVVTRAIADYQQHWRYLVGFDDSPVIRPLHWRQIASLCRQFSDGLGFDDGPERPIAGLTTALLFAIREFALRPARWEGVEPSDEQRLALLDELLQRATPNVLDLVHEWLVVEGAPDWKRATDTSGRGSALVRAEILIDDILGQRLTATDGTPSLLTDVVDQVRGHAEAIGFRVGDAVLEAFVEDDAPPAPEGPLPVPDWTQPQLPLD